MSSAGRAPLREPVTQAPENGVADAPLLLDPVEQPITLLPYLRLLWEHRRLLFRTGACSFVASALIALLIPVRFQSVTRLMPPDTAPGSFSALAAAASKVGGAGFGGVASDVLGLKSSGALFVGILQSQTVEDGLINQFHLQKEYHATKIEDARKALAAQTDVSEDRKSGIISIAVTDHDPKRAAAMAEAYVNELNRLAAQLSTSSARRERIFLEGRLKAVKTELDGSAKSFSEFASKNTAIDIPEQGKAMVEAAAKLQGELIAAQSELEGLRQIYTDNNVRVRSTEAQVNELKRKLNELGAGGTQGGVDPRNSLYPSIRQLPLLGVTYADLYRRTKIDETVYELLTQQYELAKIEEAKEIPTVRVLDAAMVPTKKSYPPRTVITVLGVFFGLTLATTWVVGKARWDATESNDPRKEFATEVFTTVWASLPKFSRNGASASPNGHGTTSLWKQPTRAGEPESPNQARQGEEKRAE